MKKIITLVLSLLLLTNITVLADDHLIIDESGVLSNMQISELEDKATEISNKLDALFMMVFTDEEPKTYADNYEFSSKPTLMLVQGKDNYGIYTNDSLNIDSFIIQELTKAYETGESYFDRSYNYLQRIYDMLAGEATTPVIEGRSRLIDLSNLLTDEQKKELSDKLDTLSNELNFDIVVLTVDDLEGKSAMAYADDFYDYNGYNIDGCILLVTMTTREYWISTSGYGITAITDKGIELMADSFVPYLGYDEYYEAFNTFADFCYDYVIEARENKPYDVNHMPKEKFNVPMYLGISSLIGLLVALVVCLIFKGQLRSVMSKPFAFDYIKEGSFNLTRVRDIYLYRRVRKTRKPEPTKSSGGGGGGGSSVHFSSSGRSHGGGGGHF